MARARLNAVRFETPKQVLEVADFRARGGLSKEGT